MEIQVIVKMTEFSEKKENRIISERLMMERDHGCSCQSHEKGITL